MNDNLTISEIYANGIEAFRKEHIEWVYPPGRKLGPSVLANRKYLDSLFIETRYFDPVEVNTGLNIFSQALSTPVFCSPISESIPYLSADGIVEIASGVSNSGSLIMLGIGGEQLLQKAMDTGAPVVKMVKPYRNTELIYKKVRDAEERGCVAVGMDMDHFYGVNMSGRLLMTEIFSPQNTQELKQLISQSKLPFIVKGVLSVTDAEKAAGINASAIILSNHGSSTIDYSIPSMIALTRIIKSVPPEITVLIDTGFQTGEDVFKALALGAKAVGFASPMLLARAALGAKGVEMLINQITAELRHTMAATGCANLAAVNSSLIIPLP